MLLQYFFPILLFTHQVKAVCGKIDITKSMDWSLLPLITTTESHWTPIRTLLLSLQMNVLSQPAVWLLLAPSLGKAISSKNSIAWTWHPIGLSIRLKMVILYSLTLECFAWANLTLKLFHYQAKTSPRKHGWLVWNGKAVLPECNQSQRRKNRLYRQWLENRYQ